MASYNYNISINGNQLPVSIEERSDDEHTYYDVLFEDHTLTIYKNTQYTWTSDNPGEFSKADIQSIGEQIIDPQP